MRLIALLVLGITACVTTGVASRQCSTLVVHNLAFADAVIRTQTQRQGLVRSLERRSFRVCSDIGNRVAVEARAIGNAWQWRHYANGVWAADEVWVLTVRESYASSTLLPAYETEQR